MHHRTCSEKQINQESTFVTHKSTVARTIMGGWTGGDYGVTGAVGGDRGRGGRG